MRTATGLVSALVFTCVLAGFTANLYGATYTVAAPSDIQTYTDLLQPGDVLEIPAGTYTLGTWRINQIHGTAEAPITIQGVGGQAAINGTAYENVLNIDNSSYINFHNIGITCNGAWDGIAGIKFRQGTSHDMLFENCKMYTLTGVGFSMQSDEIYNITVRGCEFYDNQYHGIYWGYPTPLRLVHDCEIEQSYFHDMQVDPGETGYGIQIKGGSYRNIIRDNVLINCGGGARASVAVYYTTLAGGDPVEKNNVIEGNLLIGTLSEGIYAAANATIDNNVVIDCPYGININPYTGSALEHVIVRNNTVYRSSQSGLQLGGFGAADATSIVLNNASYNDDSGGYALRAPSGTGSASVANNYYYGSESGFGGGAILGNAPTVDFVTAGALLAGTTLDLYPASGSVLIDGGSQSEPHPEADFNAVARPYNSVVDVGAYEYVGDGNPGWHFAADFKGFPAGLDADFSAVTRTGMAPLTVRFENLSTGTPTVYAWDFGDGGTSAEQQPTHEYAKLGVYDVGLTITEGLDQDAKVRNDYIAVGFRDVPIGHWSFEETAACYNVGIVGGYPGGLYQPDWAVTRNQMAIYISRALAGGDANVPTGPVQPSFSDVPTDDVAYRYVEYAHANEIVFGYPDTLRYHPEYDVDRGQMAVFVARAIATPTGEPGMATYIPTTTTFADVTSDPLDPYQTCYKYVEYIADKGVTQGYPDGLYHPERVVSRGLMAIYVARAFALLP